MEEELISRAEIVALLFNVSDIAVAVHDISISCGTGRTMKKSKAELKAFLAQMKANAERTRALAEKAQAELDKREAEREK